jgi:hypothetical protein
MSEEGSSVSGITDWSYALKRISTWGEAFLLYFAALGYSAKQAIEKADQWEKEKENDKPKYYPGGTPRCY